jgi:hypothetical protein
MTGGSANSGYRSTCKLCGLSIFDEPTKWLRNPMGLVHADCEEKRDAA